LLISREQGAKIDGFPPKPLGAVHGKRGTKSPPSP
jgi:hypothetical protein